MGIVCETKEEYDALKEKAMMVKVILLDKGAITLSPIPRYLVIGRRGRLSRK